MLNLFASASFSTKDLNVYYNLLYACIITLALSALKTQYYGFAVTL